MALSVGHPCGTHSRYVIRCCLIPLGICGLKNNSRRITYGLGCVWGMPSLSPLSSLAIRVCAAQRGRDFEAPGLERGIIFRTHESSSFASSHLKLFKDRLLLKIRVNSFLAVKVDK